MVFFSKKRVLTFFLLLLIVIGCQNRYAYFQKLNTAYLIDINQSSRVFPHRVNSVGKLRDIWDVGFRSFECDLRFGDDGTDYFRVGHNIGVMGKKLETFLSSVEYSSIERIWFDFKNLNENNYPVALQRLQYLDDRFHIKQKVILESGTTGEFFRYFREAGWHTSYYLPTETILNLLSKSDALQLQNIASDIAHNAQKQNLSAVSFDSRLYNFVKTYLEPLLDADVVYHTWWGPDIYRYNFKEKLQTSKLFLDKRIKTILVRFKSKHNL